MYFYRIGYYTEEDGSYIVLTHEKKFSKDEFDIFFIESSVKILLRGTSGSSGTYGRKNINMECHVVKEEGDIPDRQKEKWSERYDFLTDKKNMSKQDYINENAKRFYSSFEEIHEDVAKNMCECFGFKMIEFESETYAEGWGGIVEDNRMFGDDDDMLDKIKDRFWEEKNKNRLKEKL